MDRNELAQRIMFLTGKKVSCDEKHEEEFHEIFKEIEEENDGD